MQLRRSIRSCLTSNQLSHVRWNAYFLIKIASQNIFFLFFRYVHFTWFAINQDKSRWKALRMAAKSNLLSLPLIIPYHFLSCFPLMTSYHCGFTEFSDFFKHSSSTVSSNEQYFWPCKTYPKIGDKGNKFYTEFRRFKSKLRDVQFESILTTFIASVVFKGCWAVVKIDLCLKWDHH